MRALDAAELGLAVHCAVSAPPKESPAKLVDLLKVTALVYSGNSVSPYAPNRQRAVVDQRLLCGSGRWASAAVNACYIAER